MSERKRFEAWARQRWTHPEDFDRRIKDPGKYNNYEVQAAWDAWQERAAQPAPSVPEGFALVNAAHFLAVLDREDWRTAKNRAELRAMLAAAPEAKP